MCPIGQYTLNKGLTITMYVTVVHLLSSDVCSLSAIHIDTTVLFSSDVCSLSAIHIDTTVRCLIGRVLLCRLHDYLLQFTRIG